GAGIVDGNGLRHAIGADGLRRKNQSGRRERYARRAAVPAERCGLPDALSEMVRVALTGPAACGSPKCRGTVNRKLPDACIRTQGCVTGENCELAGASDA